MALRIHGQSPPGLCVFPNHERRETSPRHDPPLQQCHDDDRWLGQVQQVSDMLQEAWRALPTWEEVTETELGETLSAVLLLLWSAHRFGPMPVVATFFDELVDDEALAAAVGDPLLDDIAMVAFALGASWADSRVRAERNATCEDA